MILEAVKEWNEEDIVEVKDQPLDHRNMFVLAVATSIDALATGVTFAMMGVNIWIAIAITGLTTFVFSVAGVKIGNLFGSRYQSKAELVGGLILIAMGIKILVEHLLGKA